MNRKIIKTGIATAAIAVAMSLAGCPIDKAKGPFPCGYQDTSKPEGAKAKAECISEHPANTRTTSKSTARPTPSG